MRTIALGTGVMALCAFAGCVRALDAPAPENAPQVQTKPAVSTATVSTPPVMDEEQAASLKAIASTYATRFHKVSPSLNVAPALCAAAAAPSSMLRMSKSDDTSTHGKKVYFLYAAREGEYVKDGGRDGTTQPADQVIVKEAWVAVPAGTGGAPHAGPRDVIDVDGKTYSAGERASLFIMARQGNGWRFGLVAPDGTPTTEGPATKSCHGCHDGKPDGLFGLKPAAR